MAKSVIALVVGISLSLPVAALAAAPTPGVYNSTDLGGLVLVGRGSQSWTAPANAAHGNGDVFHSQSWDGSTLATQWHFECGISSAAQTVADHRVGGTGTVVFTTTFAGKPTFTETSLISGKACSKSCRIFCGFAEKIDCPMRPTTVLTSFSVRRCKPTTCTMSIRYFGEVHK